MAEKNNPEPEHNGLTAGPGTGKVHSSGGFYEIHARGQLDSRWSEYLEGLEVKLLDNNEMILSGPIIDQSALIGVLNKLGHLNLALLSVNKINKKINKETK